MCTLLLWKNCHPRYPLIAAANRDEYLDRPSSGPVRLQENPVVVGGRDEIGGGSWFVTTGIGLLVALTNRRGAGRHDPRKRSRGGLVQRVASARTFPEARERLEQITASDYNPFILLAADSEFAAVAHGGDDGLRVDDVADGIHAITNWDIDAAVPPKAARAHRLAHSVAPSGRPQVDRYIALSSFTDPDVLAGRLHTLLGDHGGDEGEQTALCVHRASTNYGTRSSSIAIVSAEKSRTRVYHAEGPACVSTLVDITTLLRDETDAAMSKVNREGI